MNEYYHNVFRNHIDLLERRDGHFRGRSFTFFGEMGWRNCYPDLRQIPDEDKPKFILSLFITIAVDQGLFSYLPNEQYIEIERLLGYPKFGDGIRNENPAFLISKPLEIRMVTDEELIPFISEAMQLFVDEVIDFQQNHYHDLNVSEFFNRLTNDNDFLEGRGIVFDTLYRELSERIPL